MIKGTLRYHGMHHVWKLCILFIVAKYGGIPSVTIIYSYTCCLKNTIVLYLCILDSCLNSCKCIISLSFTLVFYVHLQILDLAVGEGNKTTDYSVVLFFIASYCPIDHKCKWQIGWSIDRQFYQASHPQDSFSFRWKYFFCCHPALSVGPSSGISSQISFMFGMDLCTGRL